MRLTKIAVLLAVVLVVFESCERRNGAEWELPWQSQAGSEASGKTEPAEEPGSEAETVPAGISPEEYEYPEEEDPVAGTYREGIYRQRRFDLAATFDTDWHVYTEAERSAFNVVEPGGATRENLLSVMDEGYAWFDLYAEKPADKMTLSVSIVKLGDEDAALSDEEFASYVAASMPASLAAEGLEDVSAEAAEMSFLGGSAFGVSAQGKLGEAIVFERQVTLRKDGYCAIVTAVSCDRDATEEILGMMRPL